MEYGGLTITLRGNSCLIGGQANPDGRITAYDVRTSSGVLLSVTGLNVRLEDYVEASDDALGTLFARDDSMTGSALADMISGLTGDDTISGQDGADTLRGGNGDDSLLGRSGEDVIAGDDNRATIRGGEGNDALYGGWQDDFIVGDRGDDWLRGGQNNDTMNGGAGEDTLFGDEGNYVLAGSAGADCFVFANGFGVDRIVDFEVARADEKIDLRAVRAISDFADLTNEHLFQVGANAEIRDGGNAIVLSGVDVNALDQDDFIF
ncbi:MAG: calcium-binding protein [Pseudomonadota bacterium]